MQANLMMNLHRQNLAAMILAMLSAATLAGCGSSDRAVVKGKVVHNGQPVTDGSITLAPTASVGTTGKPATGKVQSDGAFIVNTETDDDGVLIGSYEVFYNPPATSEDAASTSPYAGLVPKQAQVEVKAGENDITVELGPKR